MDHSVYLSLGSNINPRENIPQALKLLHSTTPLLKVSSAWCSKAVGTAGPDFVNLAAFLQTNYTMEELKDRILCSIEDQLGRKRTADKFAPRTIDLDIILFDGELIDENLAHHAYLILPFSELLPDYIPRGCERSLREMAKDLEESSSVRKIPDFPLS
jgi:2-amino-4-hydroxy-6-hydroxymethyldihydropteridine diphosphokinase